MCGIWAVFGCGSDFFKYCSGSFRKICGRGPEAWRLEYQDHLKDTCIGFHRLAIVDGKYGMQPLRLHQFPHCALICNGELYNCKKIRDDNNYEYETECDVECILHLIKSKGIAKAIRHLDGVFAFCLIDSVAKRVYFGRDPYGVRPMFKLIKLDGNVELQTLAVASEAKALIDIVQDLNAKASGEYFGIRPFEAGHYEEFEIVEESGRLRSLRKERYFEPLRRPLFSSNINYESLDNGTDIYANIRLLFTEACRKRLMADRRIGCLLSGGLDSSLVAAVLAKLVAEEHLPYRLQTFAIGMNDSPDLQAARLVANHIGSEHHEIRFTETDIFTILDELIYCLESFDITTVRASIGMLLIAKYIRKHTDTIVLFSGEGADELAQGYIYFKDAPDAHAAHLESLRLLNDIYLFDGLRADRTTASQGLELRVPFLDIQFTNYYLNLDEKLRRPHSNIEKWLIRQSFAESGLLPSEILWRPKEAFSDGVTSVKKSLFAIINDWIAEQISDTEFDEKSQRYVHCRPLNKEALYYRKIFDKHFANCAEHFIPYFWMPKWTNVTDPSARFIKHYGNHKNGSL